MHDKQQKFPIFITEVSRFKVKKALFLYLNAYALSDLEQRRFTLMGPSI